MKAKTMKRKICFIGAGNLATHLSKALQNKGNDIIQVYSKTIASAKMLGEVLNTEYTNSIQEISTEADLYIVALKDSAFTEVLSQIGFQDKLLVHCSGSMPITVLENYSENIGVLYPLQTFSKSKELDFGNIPVFVEANSESNSELLVQLGQTISKSVRELSSEKRKALHVAAVLACNFVNHMYTLAEEYLDSEQIPFDVLLPLIDETARKVHSLKPKEAQTGPAVRFDKNIIDDHLHALDNFPETKELYESISKSIFKHHNEKS